MLIGVPKEIKTDEYRVGLVPATIKPLTAKGHNVVVETGAGKGAGISDDDYVAAGASVLPSAQRYGGHWLTPLSVCGCGLIQYFFLSVGAVMRRRQFIRLLGGTLAWPFAARAQQSAMPVIGFLSTKAPDDTPHLTAAFRQGLKDTGFVEGQNVAVEYRFANNQNERLPALTADLVRRQVAVIVTPATPAAIVAKAATTSIPIVFEIGGDPVRLGLVNRFDRPGGNVTGVTQLNNEVAPKRLELLHELVPKATVMVYLVNPADPNVETTEIQTAARNFGVELHVLKASAERDFDAVFAKLAQLRAGGLVIGASAFFVARQEQLAALAVRHAVPAVFENRQFTIAGGLMSYGSSLTDAYRLAGVYTARILKGEKPSELPVQRTTKIELYINLKSAKALGISVPPALQARADEMIE
ncbi:MAG: ABC transporter substrate binding protein [Pseudolabrys sp.]